MSFKVNFPFQIRQASNVAYAVAREVNQCNPVLLSISGEVPTFRFEGGTTVRVHLIDMDQFTESWRTPHVQDWVVTHVELKFYKDNDRQKKISEIWEAERLQELKGKDDWWHPHVVDRYKITGEIGVFMNAPAREGFVEVDYEYNTQGHYNLWETVEYYRFVDGDLERAKELANKKLDDFLGEFDD